MKKFSKILSVALLVALVLSLGVTSAFADGNTITMKTTAGHTYKAYQVFAGDLVVNEDGSTVLSNITWGNGVDGDALLTALKADTTYGNAFAECTTAADVADVLGTYVGKAADVAAIAKIIAENKADVAATSAVADDKTITISGLADGYFLIVDETAEEDMPAGNTYSDFMLEVVKDVEVTAKDTTTTTEKSVKDINDTNNANFDDIEWADSADHDIGDKIPFQLKATVASDYDKYEEYFFAFHDEESTGLTFDPNSVKVYVDGAEITTNFDVVTDPTDDCTFEVVFDDLKEIATVKAGSVITVEYESELNTSAVIGSQGNTNKMYGEFSNNPNDDQHGKTTKDTVIVFTYKPIINKVDSEGTKLTGAGFTLYKEVANTEGAQTGAAIKAALATTNSSIEATALKDEKYYVAKVMQTIEDDESVFEFSGVDDGTYVLVETTIPAGYNAFKSVEVTVSATHADSLTALTATELFEAVEDKGELTGELEATVENNSGTTLPSTGGIGTTIFYVVGGVLVLAAIILLVTKKRMSE